MSMKIWIVIIDGANSVVNPYMDIETGAQMEGNDKLADTLNDLIPSAGENHVLIRYRAACTRPKINVWTPNTCQAEELIMKAQERRTSF